MFKSAKENIGTNHFETIKLKEMDKVKLMNRMDHKYWFHIDYLPGLLNTVGDDYYVLEIDGESQLPYSTRYFDTQQNKMFVAHHNGKLNRYKIRRRSYVLSGISFLEIKLKSNKGRTMKKRIPSDIHSASFNEKESDFINSSSPYSSDDLSLSLINSFSRITLVNRNLKERCTIDLNLAYEYREKKISLSDLVIVEVKTDGNAKSSPLAKALNEERIRAAGFSKYCVGRTVTDPCLKRNYFKKKIRRIEKTIHTGINLY
jgi:hypothetical protein